MKLSIILFIPFLALAFSACSTVQMREVKADEDFNLAQYNTFAFYDSRKAIDTLPGEYQQELQLIQREVAEQLEARGLRQSPQPDLLVNIGAVVEEKVQTRETTIWEAPVYIGQRRYSWEVEEVETGRYKLGTVSLHFVDREENKLVWKGVAEGVLPENKKKAQRKIEEGVASLFRAVPYTAP